MTERVPGDAAAPTITVYPHGELTVYFGRHYGGVSVALEPGITIESFIDRAGIPAKEVWLVAKNGQQVPRDATLAPGDSLELFAPVAGG